MKGATWLLLGVAVLGPAAARAATITVTSTRDNTVASDGRCTLREAVNNVNAAADTTAGDCAAGSGTGDTIVFNLRLPARITLREGSLQVRRDTAIVGPEPARPQRLRIVGAPYEIVFGIYSGVTATIANVKILAGRNAWTALSTAGTVSLAHCVIDGRANKHGSILSNAGTLALENCTIRNVRETAVLNYEVLDVRSTTIQGALGAIANSYAKALTITNSTISHIRSPVGGAAINASGHRAGSIEVTNSTIYANQTLGFPSGAIAFDRPTSLAVVSSTLSQNRAGPRSAGASAIFTFDGHATLHNTLVAGRRDGSATVNCFDPFGGIVSKGHNLSSDSTCVGAPSDLASAAPSLAPLADNGGPTRTVALCADVGVPHASCRGTSPALDAGDDSAVDFPLSLATDQRGMARLAGRHVDIGAFESQ